MSILYIFLAIVVIRVINYIILYRYNYLVHARKVNNPLKYENVIRVLDYGKVQGYYIKPKIKKYKGLIITFGGAEGSCLFDLGNRICNEGYDVLSLYYFKHKKLKKQLNNIDISFFEKVINYVKANNIDGSPITLIGFSKGAELALLLTQYYRVDNIVLYSPSAYIYQGVGGPSWKYKNRVIPYLKQFDGDIKGFFAVIVKYILYLPVEYYSIQSRISEKVCQDDSEWIYKTKINGKMLIFAGKSDAVWASARDARRLKEYDNEHVDYYIFEGAGHFFSKYVYVGNMYLGGEISSNIEASIKSDAILFQNLKLWHS